MMRFLLLIFIVIPVIEMALLIKAGQWLGVFPTIALVFLTAIIGVALLRVQGFATLLRARNKLEAGDVPAEEMLEGMMLAVGGALLLTPGFFTDAIGFACLLPPVRRIFARYLLSRGIWLGNVTAARGQTYYAQSWASADQPEQIESDRNREP